MVGDKKDLGCEILRNTTVILTWAVAVVVVMMVVVTGGEGGDEASVSIGYNNAKTRVPSAQAQCIRQPHRYFREYWQRDHVCGV